MILPGSHLSEMKIFRINTHKWTSSAGWDRVFFNQLCLAFHMLINNIRTFVLHDGFTSIFIVKTTCQTIYLTNFLIELRQKIPYKRGIKIISSRRAGPHNRASSSPYKRPVREGIPKIMGETKVKGLWRFNSSYELWPLALQQRSQ